MDDKFNNLYGIDLHHVLMCRTQIAILSQAKIQLLEELEAIDNKINKYKNLIKEIEEND